MNTKAQIIHQRAFSLDDAWLIGLNEAKEHQIDLRFKLLGTLQQKKEQLSTYLCAANNHTTGVASLGGASGMDLHAKIKALYESLEHSISYSLYTKNQLQGVHYFSTATAPSTEFLINQQLLPKLLLEAKYQDNDFPWIELTQYQHPENTIFYPLSLIYPFAAITNPTPYVPRLVRGIQKSSEFTGSRGQAAGRRNRVYRKSCLNELSDDTGLAIGAIAEEAILHGMNQWVERDAYSLFLLKTILPKNPTPARVVIKDSLPEELSDLINAIEQQFNEQLIVIDITSDINIPAFVVSFTQQKMHLQPLGFGASLAKDLALKQALYEVIQYKDRFNDNAQAYREDNVQFFAKTPLLLKAMTSDIRKVMQSEDCVDVTWQELISYPLDCNLEQQINLMIYLLEKQGFTVYSHILYQSKTGVSITYTLIPELEHFSLIRDGKCTQIKKRGLGALQC